MYTFFIASEGKTDFDALKILLHKIAQQCEKECKCEPIFPHVDANFSNEKLRGWDGLRQWCERSRGAPANLYQRSQQDLLALQNAGINLVAHTVSAMPGWTFYQNANGEPTSLVFHLDADIAEKLTKHHPDGAYAPATDRAEYCCKALQHWTGLTENAAIWCVPVQCLETWFLTLHSLDDCKSHMPEVTDYESTPNHAVYDLLCCLGHPSYFDTTKGCTTVDKIHLAQNHAEALAGALDTLCAQCPSAQSFVTDVTTRLTA